MEPFEILTSESQERMLAIVRPQDVGAVRAVCSRWGLPATPVAKLRGGGRLFVRLRGKTVARAPARALSDEGPVYERPMERPPWLDRVREDDPVSSPISMTLEEAVRGSGDACRAFRPPVTGGNVSFYNEAGSSAVDPTPVVGMVGVIDDYRLLLRPGFPSAELPIYLLGETLPEVGGSEFAEV